ncbi:MAG: hypothetical protein ACUVSB_14525, partial [Anaerolineae bacterium]
LTVAIPATLTWPQTALALIGAAAIVIRRSVHQLLLLGLVIIFLLLISLSYLHWQRWIIPVLPVLALVVASPLESSARFLASHLSGWKRGIAENSLLAAVVLAVSLLPLYEVCRSNIRQSNYSTRVLAHEWILSNLPADSLIAKEAYAAPLTKGGFGLVTERFSLATGYRLEDYLLDGYHYLVVSSWIYNRFLRSPERYPAEVGFYQELFSRGRLVRAFEPLGDHRPGPTIRVYDIRDTARSFLEGVDWSAEPLDVLIRANAHAESEILHVIHDHLRARLPANLDLTLVDNSNIPRVRVWGYALEPHNQSEGGAELRLYFEALDRMDVDYTIFLHGVVEDVSLLPPERQQYGFANWDHRLMIPTSQWRPGRIYADAYRIQTASGKYRLRFGFWEPRSKARLTVQGSGAQAIDLGWHRLP